MNPDLEYSHEDQGIVYYKCSKRQHEHFSQERQCPVCLETKKNQGVLDCNHFICLRCILRLVKNECPLCRGAISAPWIKDDLKMVLQENFEQYEEERREEQVAQDSLIASMMEAENTITYINPLDFIRSALNGNFLYFNIVPDDEEQQDEDNNQQQASDSDDELD